MIHKSVLSYHTLSEKNVYDIQLSGDPGCKNDEDTDTLTHFLLHYSKDKQFWQVSFCGGIE